MKCRACNARLSQVFIDLGMSPLSNSYRTGDQLHEMEPHYPLKVFLCDQCWLVQLPAMASSEAIFSDYAYFSSFSDTWLAHAEAYVDMMIGRFDLREDQQIIEIASNDGYLLKNFVRAGFKVLGIEPAENVARVARDKGVPTDVQFFGVETAQNLVAGGQAADLLLGNNVLAHVPDLNDFIAGMKIALKPDGIITMEFPHLLRMMAENQFDTIYHEHFSYFSFLAVEQAFARHDITLFDVDELPTHGGSLRIYGSHAAPNARPVSPRVGALRKQEREAGITVLSTYAGFARKVHETKNRLLKFLIESREAGHSVVAYGAPAKGNTLLNYAGVRTDLLDYTVDRSHHKQGKYLPGTHIPIYAPEKIAETKPDFVLILPWNIREEIMGQMAHIREWGGRFVVPIPRLEVLE